MDRAADILHRGIAQDLDVSRLGIDLHVADMGGEPGPAPWALIDTSALIGPPVRPDLIAISASDNGSKLPALEPAGNALPSFHSTASGLMSQIAAARDLSCSTTFSAA